MAVVLNIPKIVSLAKLLFSQVMTDELININSLNVNFSEKSGWYGTLPPDQHSLPSIPSLGNLLHISLGYSHCTQPQDCQR